MSGLGLTFLRRGGQAHPTAGLPFIRFKDPAVEAICVAKWSADGVHLSYEDAASVTSIGTLFKGNTEITSFNELQYFTGLTSLDKNAFSACTLLSEVTLPESVTTLNQSAFTDCTALEKINLDKVVTIGRFVFDGCVVLGTGQDLIAPNLTGTLGSRAFQSTAYTNILNLGTVSLIEAGYASYRGTFAKMTKLKKVVIPASMATIDELSFYYDKAITAFLCYADKPPAIKGNTFFDAATTFNFYVPDASVDAYKAASYWSSFASRIKPLSEYNG